MLASLVGIPLANNQPQKYIEKDQIKFKESERGGRFTL